MSELQSEVGAGTPLSSEDIIEGWVALELQAGRPVQIKALGRSMWPWLRSGARVTLSPVDLKMALIGHVVVSWRADARPGERLSPAHRVIWVSRGYVFTKGDALPRLDEPAQRDAVLGYVSGVDCAEPQRWGARLMCRVRSWVCVGALWPVAVLFSGALTLLIHCRRSAPPTDR